MRGMHPGPSRENIQCTATACQCSFCVPSTTCTRGVRRPGPTARAHTGACTSPTSTARTALQTRTPSGSPRNDCDSNPGPFRSF
eukprot:5620595-Pyramimonas_sp.AAC.1